MSSMHHPNIIRCYGTCKKEEDAKTRREYNHNPSITLLIFLEFVPVRLDLISWRVLISVLELSPAHSVYACSKSGPEHPNLATQLIFSVPHHLVVPPSCCCH